MKLHKVVKKNRTACADVLDVDNSDCNTPTKAKQSDDENEEQFVGDASNEKQSRGSEGQDSNSDEVEDDEAE